MTHLQLRLGASPAVLAALTVTELAAVAYLAAARPNDGAVAVLVALVLAPLAVSAVVSIGAQLAGPRFAAGAGCVYVVLPFAAHLFFYGSFLAVYDDRVAPALVGLRSPAWFALGVVVGLVVALAPAAATAAAGVLALVAALVAWVDTDWTHVYDNFHETTWSPTLLSLLPFACVLAVGLRSPRIAAALGGWSGVLILRGVHRPDADGGLWLSLAAATPAAALLLTSLALLVPRLSVPGTQSARPAPRREAP